jgi:hypothetical protein
MKAVYWFTIYFLVGLWSLLAPYALSFSGNTEAFWSSLIVGVLLILISAVGLYIEREEEAGAHFPHSSQKKPA